MPRGSRGELFGGLLLAATRGGSAWSCFPKRKARTYARKYRNRGIELSQHLTYRNRAIAAITAVDVILGTVHRAVDVQHRRCFRCFLWVP